MGYDTNREKESELSGDKVFEKFAGSFMNGQR